MKTHDDKKNQKHEKRLLNFLQKTKDGKYAKVEESSLNYVRVKEEREEIEPCVETYYYNIS